MAGEELGSEAIAKLWAAFSVFDEDSDGSISACELERALRDLGRDISLPEAAAMIAEADTDGSGTLQFSEFRALVAAEHGDREARLRIAFETLDRGNDGTVDASDLEPATVHFGLDGEALRALIATVDGDGDGRIDFAEFASLMPEHAEANSYQSASTPPRYAYDPRRFEHQTLEQDAAAGDTEAIARLRAVLDREAADRGAEQGGTSRLQIQIGFFRLIQGAAYRCFRESFSANHETHLRVRDLPYRITDFVAFTRLCLEIYKGLGVVDDACFPVIDAVTESLEAEFARLQGRIEHWETTPKTSAMLVEAERMGASADRTDNIRQCFAAGIEYVIALRARKINVAHAAAGVLARQEINELRQRELEQEMAPSAPAGSDGKYLERWNRVILNDADERIPGAMMPVAYWYEEFMPRLLAAMSVSDAGDIHENTVPDESALDRWFAETAASGEFDRYGADVADHFSGCTPMQKLAIRQAWRLTRRYLNGLQKRREREEFGRESGALSQYVAFIDVYLGRAHVEHAEMRVSFPYYIGPPVWRLLHTSAEILCGASLERQKLGLRLFVEFFQLFATMYPCPYCRHHLNAYVVRNREVDLYPLEYLVLGHNSENSELEMSPAEKLRSAASAPELRLFLWKLHNTVSASIARVEPWYHEDARAFYTTRYWPSLDSELARATALHRLSIATERVARIYGLLRPAARLAGLRTELRRILQTRDSEDLQRIVREAEHHIRELETAVLEGDFLQRAYHFDPERIDPPLDFSEEEENLARSGDYTECY